MSGCIRTEGYRKIEEKEKRTYRSEIVTQVTKPLSVQSTISTARMDRFNYRMLKGGTQTSDSDLWKFNQLKSRKKRLKFDKSTIHDWGLFALETIDANDMVIEYIGEIVREKVADIREKSYEKMGIGSSYLFRIDDNTIIDATTMGNSARFINHSCDVRFIFTFIRMIFYYYYYYYYYYLF